MSVRLVGVKRRSEGMTMGSLEETTSWNDQEDGMMKGKCGGRQRLKHVDGDVPLCMRNKDEEREGIVKDREGERKRRRLHCACEAKKMN